MALRCSYAGAGLCLSWEFGRKVRGMIEPSCLNPFPSWAEKLQTTAVAMGPDWDPADVKVFGSPFLRFPLRVYTAVTAFHHWDSHTQKRNLKGPAFSTPRGRVII